MAENTTSHNHDNPSCEVHVDWPEHFEFDHIVRQMTEDPYNPWLDMLRGFLEGAVDVIHIRKRRKVEDLMKRLQLSSADVQEMAALTEKLEATKLEAAETEPARPKNWAEFLADQNIVPDPYTEEEAIRLVKWWNENYPSREEMIFKAMELREKEQGSSEHVTDEDMEI